MTAAPYTLSAIAASPCGVPHASAARLRAAGRAPPAPALLGLGDVPPPWPATWQLNLSTAIMPANYNGFTSNVSQWGYVDFDWLVASPLSAHCVASPGAARPRCGVRAHTVVAVG